MTVEGEERQSLIVVNSEVETTSDGYGGVLSNTGNTANGQNSTIAEFPDSSISYQNPSVQFNNPTEIMNDSQTPVNTIATIEPRSRTTSERFHCHIVQDNESEDNVSGVAGSDRRRGGGGQTTPPTNTKAIRVLWLSVIVCLLFMLCEVVGGVWAQSLAIITDAAHLLTDLASMLISLFSLYLASRPASQRMSFGWYRAEVVGAFISVFLIWVVTGVLVYLAVDRIITQNYDINARVMAVTAGIGVLVNLIMGALLYFGGHSHSHLGIKHSHSHSHSNNHSHSRSASSTASVASNGTAANDCEALLDTLDNSVAPHKHTQNINVRAAFIHVLGDLIQSVGVLLAALLILWKESLAIMDPICTLFFSLIVVCTTVYIIRDALVVLLEGRPSNINFSHVFQALEQIDGVQKVHDLRIWALTTDKVAISVHLEISSNAHAQTILKNTTLMLRREFNVYESTVQIEGWRPESVNCFQCIVPAR